MIGLTRAVRVLAYGSPADMRKSYNGLESLVRRELGHDIMDGDLFLFINRRRNRARIYNQTPAPRSGRHSPAASNDGILRFRILK